MLIGLAAGVVLNAIVAQPLAAFLAEGVSPGDPLAIGMVIAICLLGGGVAALLPARRALSVAPMTTLRVD